MTPPYQYPSDLARYVSGAALLVDTVFGLPGKPGLVERSAGGTLVLDEPLEFVEIEGTLVDDGQPL